MKIMTNLEMEQKIQAMDEELTFQMPIDYEEELEFSVIEADESFFITEQEKKEPVKRSNPKKVGNTSKRAEKFKNEHSDASTEANFERVVEQQNEAKEKKIESTEVSQEKDTKKTPYMQGSESPTIKIIPFVTTENTTEESFSKEENNTEPETVTETPSPTEEFFEEEPITQDESDPLTGEVDKESSQNVQHENNESSRFKASENTNVFRMNIPELPFEKFAEISKQVLSAVAVLAIFFLCTSTYSYYIDKHPSVDTQAKTLVEETTKKAESTIKYYEEQAEQQKEEIKDTANTDTTSIKASNKVKLEKLMKKEHEEPAETNITRFQSLSDLTNYINDNTILLKDILENSEKKRDAGIITDAEYANIISQAKDKLAELSTLLTTNRAVYNQEECIEDYDILYNNINVVNEMY